jgi:hypothetical protein
MSRITQRVAVGPLALVSNGLIETATSTETSLDTLVGTRFETSDGRELTLVKAGAVALTSGVLVQDAAIIANHQNLAVTAYQAFSANGNVQPKVTVTLGATAATANQYAGGFVVVNDNAGEGQTLRIASHPAAAGSASLVLTLEEGAFPLITTASEVCLLPAHGMGVIIQPTTVTGAQVGVTMGPIAAGEYGYVVSRGLAACLAQGAIGVGLGLSVGTVAGSVAVAAATTARLGFASQAGVDTEYRMVYLTL